MDGTRGHSAANGGVPRRLRRRVPREAPARLLARRAAPAGVRRARARLDARPPAAVHGA